MMAISTTVGEDGETSVSDNYLSAAMAGEKFYFSLSFWFIRYDQNHS